MLDPVLEDKTLRFGGMLHKSAMPEETEHPAIVICRKSLTNLLQPFYQARLPILILGSISLGHLKIKEENDGAEGMPGK